jgi:hypothetical protein
MGLVERQKKLWLCSKRGGGMKVAEETGLERGQQPQAAEKRRYEPPQLLKETMDVAGTYKTAHSPHDTSVFGPSVS